MKISSNSDRAALRKESVQQATDAIATGGLLYDYEPKYPSEPSGAHL